MSVDDVEYENLPVGSQCVCQVTKTIIYNIYKSHGEAIEYGLYRQYVLYILTERSVQTVENH